MDNSRRVCCARQGDPVMETNTAWLLEYAGTPGANGRNIPAAPWPEMENRVLKFVFWQSYLMSHQAGYIRALAERHDCQVRWVVEQPLPEHYRIRGYAVPALGRVEPVIAPDAEQVDALLGDDPENTVHVFMGLRRSRLSGRAFRRSLRYPVRRFFLSENRFEHNWRLPLRWALYGLHALQYRRHIDRLLCMGYLGRRGGRAWFRLCGYPDRLISPFVYT
ncbi:MAG: hypothetical protein M3Q40_07715, partial [Pseudomonadota bacterium]|nr:hypothetical protein [Pseudomonadota bacterium]